MYTNGTGTRKRGEWALELMKGLGAAALVLLTGAGMGGCSEGDSAPRGQPSVDGGPTGNSPLANHCTQAECTATGKQCDPFVGCVDCLLGSHCPEGLRCFQRACEPAFACTTDADCAAYPSMPSCDPGSGTCVRCSDDSDCPGTAHCRANACVPYAACVNSFDCPTGKVCDRSIGECVECFQAGDCNGEAFELCVHNRCAPGCLSDNDCLALNKLCDTEGGYCASCIRHEDCPSTYYCLNDECAPDVCAPGEVRCTGDRTVAICSASGATLEVSDCGSRSTCVSGPAPGCTSWLCEPNEVTCDAAGLNAVTCSADGLSATVTQACEGEGKVCRSGACIALACSPDTIVCSPEGNVASCSRDGLSLEVSEYCDTTEYCDAPRGTCSPRTCTPGTLLCDGQVATVCPENGSGAAPGGTDCEASGQVCEAGTCHDVVCTPGQAVCNSAGEVETCNATGTAATTRACLPGLYCGLQDGQATCLIQACTPGEPACEGNRAGTCNAAGNGVEGITTCTSDQACFAGTCRPLVCRGQYDCIDNSVHRCSDQGTASALSTNCPNSIFGVAMHCVKSGDLADCVVNRCIPGQPACDGSTLRQCNAIGGGYEPGGTDCAATGGTCYGAQCLPVVCQGTRDCVNGAVHSCLNQGTSSSHDSICGSTSHCEKSGASASCVANTCTPGASACNGDTLTRCNAIGNAYEPGGTDCTATGGVCFRASPQCLPKICEPSALYCKSGTGNNGDVFRCGTDGATDSLYRDCSQDQHCTQVDLSTSCTSDICTENQLGCDGSRVAMCNAHGSGYLPGGVICTNEPGTQNCRAGACRPVICTASEPYCIGTTLTSCDSTGTLGTSIQECSGTNYCAPKSGTDAAACKTDFCNPGLPTCNVEVTKTCSADGGSYETGGTNCANTGRVCTLEPSAAACANQAVDTIGTGSMGMSGTNTLALNAYSLRTTRSLTEIQQSMNLLTGTSIVTWVVFERTGTSGSYSKIFDRAVPTTGDGTFKLQSSGAIDVPLVAGREYLIGHLATASAGVQSFWQQQYPSFGVLLGRVRTSSATAPATLTVTPALSAAHLQVLTSGPP